MRNKRTNNKAGHSNPIGANWYCFCFKTDEHPRGWRKCPQLRKLYPGWKQGDRLPNFNIWGHVPSIPPLVDSKFEEWGGVSKPNNVVLDRRRPSPRTTEEMKVLQRGVTKGKTSKRFVVVQGQDLGWELVLVIDTPKGTKDRYKKLREKKMAWHQILSRSPHVMVHLGTEDCSALLLLDTGADWSLIDESLLSDEERTGLEHSGDHGLYDRGVSGESITILGEVWRTLTLGDLRITEQRFVVVHGLLSRVILGADFWARVSPLQIDFHNRNLKLCGGLVNE